MTLAGVSVLLAEDNPTNQMVASHMLESLGADVTIAMDGAEALEMLTERSFDVALIDIEMPRISGLDLIRRLRADPGPVAAMPMIALTAYVMREHRAAIEEAGADGIIAKPIVSIDRFGGEIAGHMSQRRARSPTIATGAADDARGVDARASGARIQEDATAVRRFGERRAATPRAADLREALFDHAVFDSLCSAFEPADRRELVRRLGEDIGTACEAIARSIRARDFRGLHVATHPLMAIAGVIGAARLQSLAERLNSAGHAADDRFLDHEGSELLLEAERVLRFVCRDQEETVR